MTSISVKDYTLTGNGQQPFVHTSTAILVYNWGHLM